MKKRQRKQYSANLKAKIAVEAVKGQRTIQEIASHYEVHPNMVTKWKKQVLEGASGIFSSGKAQASEADEQVQAELYPRAQPYGNGPARLYKRHRKGRRQAHPGRQWNPGRLAQTVYSGLDTSRRCKASHGKFQHR